MKKIIVTGCNGQLGRAINLELAGNPELEFVNTDVNEKKPEETRNLAFPLAKNRNFSISVGGTFGGSLAVQGAGHNGHQHQRGQQIPWVQADADILRQQPEQRREHHIAHIGGGHLHAGQCHA